MIEYYQEQLDAAWVNGLWVGAILGIMVSGAIAMLVTALVTFVGYYRDRRRLAQRQLAWAAGMLPGRTRVIA